MRVLFCKIHCPFICFCKPSPSIYTPGPLKLENTPQAASTEVVSVANASADGSIEVKEESVAVHGKQPESPIRLKSSLRKAVLDSKEVEKKKVQWIDLLGKELAEIREFEASETEDADHEDQSSRACFCAIL